MEEEAAALREMQAKVEKEMGAIQGLFRTLTFFFFSPPFFEYSRDHEPTVLFKSSWFASSFFVCIFFGSYVLSIED